MNTIIKFDMNLYNSEAVMQAIKDYKTLAYIFVTKNDSREICCSLSNCKYGPDLTVKEFANYVLCLSIKFKKINGVKNVEI